MFLPLITAIINHEAIAIKAFMLPVLACLIISSVGLVYFKQSNDKLLIRETNLLIVLSLLISIAVGAVPFIIVHGLPGTMDAFFESCSAFTTTGASVMHSMLKLPKSLILWRSLAGWLGGLGIVFIITMHMNIKKALIYIYLIFSAITFILLLLTGNAAFDSIVLTLNTVSTTGFSTASTGVASLTSMTKLVLIVIMILSGVSYLMYYNAAKKGLNKGFKFIIEDPEFKLYAMLVIAISLEIGIINVLHSNAGSIHEVSERLLSSLFHVASTISTTGFTSEPYFMWPTSSLVLLFGLTIIGGCANSPSSGIKCRRIIVEYKLIRRNLAMRLHPNRVAKMTYNNSEITTGEVIRVSNYVITYIVIVFIGVLLLSTDKIGFVEAFSATLSCMSNLGQGLGILNSIGNYATLSAFSKAVCMILMIIGRLEIFPFLTLFSKYYWHPNATK